MYTMVFLMQMAKLQATHLTNYALLERMLLGAGSLIVYPLPELPQTSLLEGGDNRLTLSTIQITNLWPADGARRKLDPVGYHAPGCAGPGHSLLPTPGQTI